MGALKEASQIIKEKQAKIREQWEMPMRMLVDGITHRVHRSLAEYIRFGSPEPVDDSAPEIITPLNTKIQALNSNMSLYLGSPLAKSEWLNISQEMVDDFARVTGDDQWIHVDPVRARDESPFRGTIVHGYFILSLLPKLVKVESLIKKMSGDYRMIINSGLSNVEFRSPLRTGTSMRVSSTLSSIQCAKKGVDVTFLFVVEAQREGNICCVAESRIKVIV